MVSGGNLADYRRKEEPWWQKYQTIIALSAFVGAFLSLWERGAQLIEPPDIYIETSADSPIELLRDGGAAQTIKFYVTNRCRFASISVDLKADFVPLLFSGNTKLTNAARLSRIEPGTTKEVLLRADSSAQSISQGPPVAYEFRLNAEATAGLKFTRSLDYKSRPFRMWSGLALTPPVLTTSPTGTCLFQGQLYSGRAQDGTVSVTAWHPQREIQAAVIGVALRGRTVSSADRPPQQQSPSRRVFKQSLNVPALEAFKTYSYSVSVVTPGMKAQTCSEVTLEPLVLRGEKQ